MEPQRFRYLQEIAGLGALLVLSYVAWTLSDRVLASHAMHGSWEALLPGFNWWSWDLFLFGLVETLAYGFWLGLYAQLVARSPRWRTAAAGPTRPSSERSAGRAT
jgi:hypothetical protein